MKNSQNYILIALAILCIAGVAWSLIKKGKFQGGQPDGSPLPVTQSDFKWKDEKGKVREQLEALSINTKVDKEDEFDVSGDGVPEGIFETSNSGEYVVMREAEKDSVAIIDLFQKFEDEKGTPLKLYKSKSDGSVRGYFGDVETHSFVQYTLAGGACTVEAYRWEQVKRGVVKTDTIDETVKTRYCDKAKSL